MAIMNFLDNLPTNSSYMKFLDFFSTKFIEISKYPNNEIKMNLQTGILSIIQTCIIKGKNEITVQIAEILYKMVIDSFNLNKTISADGIYMISALIAGKT